MRAAPIAPEVDAPETLAEIRRRRLVNHALLWLGPALLAIAAGVVAFKAVRHAVAASWLQTNSFRVDWGIGPEDRAAGGATTVKANAKFGLASPPSTKDELPYLGWLHRVESLDLSRSYHLSDADLAILPRLVDLKLLNLDRSRHGEWPYEARRVTDATLAAIRPLTRLRDLNLGGQGISDAGLAYLRGFRELQALDLRQTGVTDAAFDQLKAFPALKSVDLTGTRVTSKGLIDFEAARPGVRVLTDPMPSPQPAPRASR